jgi:hypothetical protein
MGYNYSISNLESFLDRYCPHLEYNSRAHLGYRIRYNYQDLIHTLQFRIMNWINLFQIRLLITSDGTSSCGTTSTYSEKALQRLMYDGKCALVRHKIEKIYLQSCANFRTMLPTPFACSLPSSLMGKNVTTSH